MRDWIGIIFMMLLFAAMSFLLGVQVGMYAERNRTTHQSDGRS